MLLAVPEDDPDSQEIMQITAEVPFPVVTAGRARDGAQLYPVPQNARTSPTCWAGHPAPHMEFLVDRYGYLRARWIPEADGPGWSDTDMLMQQVAQLNREKEILPPRATMCIEKLKEKTQRA